MARRQARYTAQDLADDPRLQDHSPDLWRADLAAVPRGLLTSAVRCFAANGFHATTTRDIAEGVGLSPAALYVHFPSKELVLFEIIRAGHERVLEYVRDPAVLPAHGDGSADRLRAVIAGYTVWHARHHVAARVCQLELAGLTAEHYDEILEVRHRTNAFFRDTVARGVADGSFAQVDVKRVTRAMLSLSIDLVRWYRLDGSDSPEQLGEFYAALAIRMVAPPG
ncbi:TetR/AcrR family transcriptional regulator [Actinomadura darangshiensis]|uniref:TetR/AcrR family transcriptional regulator n=1 Tax=Actinomadura darangshiensis TaxID=705336 RepID=A0A4R5BQI7_9ACTN|nr:TetR/AcrR family transcriptional regulator [Actinomadura darangshiensis]TDD87490.1 TetR/AcrR family transcriptional regulator [Actinomadura darangshiensis]